MTARVFEVPIRISDGESIPIFFSRIDGDKYAVGVDVSPGIIEIALVDAPTVTRLVSRDSFKKCVPLTPAAVAMCEIAEQGRQPSVVSAFDEKWLVE